MKGNITAIVLLMLAFMASAQGYDEWVERSFMYIESDSLSKAEESLKNAMRLEPANPRNFLLLSNLGTLQRRLGKNDDALISYSSALMMAPKSVPALENRAALYSEMERWDEALQDYTSIIYVDDDNQEALYRRGLIRLEKNDTIGARTDFETILKADETSAKARLGIASLMIMEKHYNMAADLYSQLIKVNAKNGDLYLKRAQAYYLAGKQARALADIDEALRYDAEDAYAYVLKGRIRLAQFDKTEALINFKRAQELGFEDNLLQDLMKKCR